MLTRGALVLSPEFRGVVCTYLGPAIERRHPENLDDEGQPTGEYDMSEIEEIELDDRARIRMVGDDTIHVVDVDTLKPHKGPVCSCGQVGCGWHGEEEEDEGSSPESERVR